MRVRNYNTEKKEFENIFIGSPIRYHSRFICYKDENNFVFCFSNGIVYYFEKGYCLMKIIILLMLLGLTIIFSNNFVIFLNVFHNQWYLKWIKKNKIKYLIYIYFQIKNIYFFFK